MKKKYLWLITASLVVAGSAWFGRAAWRAHQNIVSLHVRNVPLRDVIRQIERQTWEHISVDKKLDTLITLDVRNKPLSTVLDRLAQQSGARWFTVYAVYESKQALPKLETALYGDKKFDEVGWRLIAPAGLNLDSTNLNLPEGLAGGGRIFMTNAGAGGGPVIIRRGGPPPDGLPPGAVVTTEDQVIRDHGPDPAASGGAAKVRRQEGAPIVMTVRRRGDGGAMEQEVWSPVELLLEARLSSRLGDDFDASPSREGAVQAAQKVKGKWKAYYSMKKSAFGFGLAGMPNVQRTFKAGPGESPARITREAGTNSLGSMAHAGVSTEDLTEALGRQHLDELGKLTPEQRVQRARERQALGSKN